MGWEGPRKPLAFGSFRNIAKSGTALFAVFSAGKMETSDFFEGKFRGFALKVRMFVLEKSDVFRRKQGGKAVFFPVFRGVFALFPAICSVLMSRNGGRKGLNVCENDRLNAENRPGTGGGPCQNISRCLCFFYILRKAFWGCESVECAIAPGYGLAHGL